MPKEPLEVTAEDVPEIEQPKPFFPSIMHSFWHSAQIDQVATALAVAQLAIKPALKDALNPHFRSKYADLASIWEACREQLTSAGIAVVQAPTTCGAVVEMVTMLVHKSGQFFASKLAMIAVDERPQSIGSTITYARRYALAAMAGVAPDDDDDGNQGSGRGKEQEQPKRDSKPATARAAMPNVPPSGRVPAPELVQFFEAIDKDAGQIKEAMTHLEKEFVRLGGPRGLNIYNDCVDAFRAKWPKGTETKGLIKDLLMDMWEAIQKLEQEPVPF